MSPRKTETRRSRWLVAIGILAALTVFSSVNAAENAGQVDFAQDVQPVLRRHCFRCHGSKNQEASLQLNVRRAAMSPSDSGEPVIVPHDAEASLLVQRIVDEDAGEIMPLDGDPLSSREIELLKRWINEGAVWPDSHAQAKHWAYQPVRRPDVVAGARGDESPPLPIDYFILRRLKQRGLKPTALLDRPRLIRRVSLALTGVPPTPDEVRRFVEDKSEDAYEKSSRSFTQFPALRRALGRPMVGSRAIMQTATDSKPTRSATTGRIAIG